MARARCRRRPKAACRCAAVLLVAMAATASATEGADADEALLPGILPLPGEVALADRWHVYWQEGLHVDGRRLRLLWGGRLQLDGGVLDPESSLAEEFDVPGTYTRGEVRRARVRVNGTFARHYFFTFAYDFGQSSFANLLVGARDLSLVDRIRLGNQKEPFSLEAMTSSNDTVFLEPGLPNALVPRRNVGVRVDEAFLDRRLEVSVGGFANTGSLRPFSEVFSDTGDGADLTLRVAGQPIFEKDGRRLLHVGLAYLHGFRNDQQIAYQSTPESNLAPILASTGTLTTTGLDVVDVAAAWVDGPLAVQGEWAASFVGRSDAGGVRFSGLYVFASYFLTGENRRFNARWGVFQRILPDREFSLFGPGFGAVEIAARYSRLDLDSGDVSGGVLNDATLGVNWYLTSNVRVTGNVILSRLRSSGHIEVGELRFQVAY